MDNFADRLIKATEEKGNPCVVGLDPRIDQMPQFILDRTGSMQESVRSSINAYHRLIIDGISDMVSCVKLQSSFYEQYGLGGIQAFYDTIEYSKKLGMLTIVDGKRNDISFSAAAYANAYLGRTIIFDKEEPIVNADCLTVSAYLGHDGIEPFFDACKAYGKGIFILVKTSNAGSLDFQDLTLNNGSKLYNKSAEFVNEYAEKLLGERGYSSIGAVVGATFPEAARDLRKSMPKSIFLVPGYGTQGGKAASVAECFNKDGLGAVVTATRSITYGLDPSIKNEASIKDEIRSRTENMIKDISQAMKERGMG